MFRTSVSRLCGAVACFPLICAAAPGSPSTGASDIYDAAMQHRGRTSADHERDKTDYPAEVMRVAGIKPGMKVADVLGLDGYYSELLSYVVGPEGHVLMLNNYAYDYYSRTSWRSRAAGKRLPNVEYRIVDLEHLDLPSDSLDAVVLIKIFHEINFYDTRGGWPKVDPGKILTELARVLKSGGIAVLEDHSARPGSGNADAGTLHRIDEAYSRAQFEAHGFELVAQSDVLRRPADARNLLSTSPAIRGFTDRFVLVFHKRAAAAQKR